MEQNDTKLAAALQALVDPDEYFYDYLAFTSAKYCNVDDTNAAQIELAKETIQHAIEAFRQQDVPFYPPATFETETYRDPKLMHRIAVIEEKRQKELEKRQEKRRAALERKSQGESKGKIEKARRQTARQYREAIEKWKEAREIARKNGGDPEQIKLEEIYREMSKQQRMKRASKDKKYGHEKKSRKNDAVSAMNDKYRHRQFEHK